MASSKDKDLKVIEMFRSNNFYNWKKKIKLLIASFDLWDIIDESKILKTYMLISIKNKSTNVMKRRLLD